jgi:hypothetical protein
MQFHQASRVSAYRPLLQPGSPTPFGRVAQCRQAQARRQRPADGRTVCAVSLKWLDESRSADPGQVAELERDGRLVVLESGTVVVDNGSMVWPPHPAVTQVKVRSGPNHGAKCWIDGPVAKVL